ncbi:SGNH/GDSL hydrolase family protein [Streptomyces sannanensis]|uniref:SGNH/GDSL hydrolase family protein n=1 Tax=Streptomyces sannanensis TaxID=285536 RepID=A0ABP6S8W4_9ACTN
MHRIRAAVAAWTTAALVSAGMLTGCDPGGGTDAAGSPPPRPKPTPVWDRSPASIAAVGDSITRGFDACEVLSDCPEVSWATGSDTEVGSLATRLLGVTTAASRSWNYARTGARMADLPAQLSRAAAHRPELVTVMAGANDACRDSAAQMTPVAEFRASFASALGQLRRELPKTQVYVSSVPDLKRLWSTGRDSVLGRTVWKLGVCASMLGDAENDGAEATARRTAVYDRVVAYNQALQEECGKDPRCRYDGGAVFAYPFTGEQLSHWDWFHPGKNGQRELADIAYRNVTAEEPPT